MEDETQEVEEKVEETAQAVPPAESNDAAEEVQKAKTFAKKSEDYRDRNWTEARRKMQELEKKASEQEEVIKRLSAPASTKDDDDLDKLGDEDIVTKAQAKRLAAKMAEEIAQRVIRQREASTVDERLQLKFPDFAQVVSEENINYLIENEPELAESLKLNPDPFKQGVAAYKLMKNLGINTGEDVKTPSREKDKAIKNSQKPLSVNAVTKTSAIGNAHMFENGLTPELKASLRKEMAECAKRM